MERPRNYFNDVKDIYVSCKEATDCIKTNPSSNILLAVTESKNKISNISVSNWKDSSKKKFFQSRTSCINKLKIIEESITNVFMKSEELYSLLDSQLENLKTANDECQNIYNNLPISPDEDTIDKEKWNNYYSSLTKWEQNVKNKCNYCEYCLNNINEIKYLLIEIDSVQINAKANSLMALLKTPVFLNYDEWYSEYGIKTSYDSLNQPSSKTQIFQDLEQKEEEKTISTSDTNALVQTITDFSDRQTIKNNIATTKMDGRDISYWSYTPQEDTEGLPLVIYLHGGGATPTKEGLPLEIENGDDYEAVVISPQRPDERNFFWKNETEFMDYVEEMKSKYGSSTVSLIGYSRGSIEALEIAANNPGYFDSVVAVSTTSKESIGGVVLEDLYSLVDSGTKVWQLHGKSDGTFDLTTQGKVVYDYMEEKGVDAFFTSVYTSKTGQGHSEVLKIFEQNNKQVYKDQEINVMDFVLNKY